MADGQFADPHGVAVDSAGNVYAADTNNNCIQKFGMPSLNNRWLKRHTLVQVLWE